MNHMFTIACLMDVKLNEPFKIKFYRHREPFMLWYKINSGGLVYSYQRDGVYKHSQALDGLLSGKHQIVKES